MKLSKNASNTACTGPLLSFGHLPLAPLGYYVPLKGKTQHREHSGFEFSLLPSRVHARPSAMARRGQSANANL